MSTEYVESFYFFKLFLISGLEFFQEMILFVLYLPTCDRQNSGLEIPIYFFSVKIIISSHCFFIYFSKILIDSIESIFCIFKSQELRVIFISFCISSEDIFCEQSLPPESRETFCIEIARMKGPDAHLFSNSIFCVFSSFLFITN